MQNVENHCLGYTHEITNGTESYEITSLHHQMVFPWTISSDYYKILYWTPRRSSIYEGDRIDPAYFRRYGEPEIVFYNVPDKPKCLGIQGHPEMMSDESITVKMCNELVKSYLS